MPDSPTPGQFERLVSFAASVVAPLSVISALLFYFGYASSRAQYEYFGIDVDTIGLSTRDYVMRSPQPLLVPVLVLALLAVGLTVLHAGVRRRIGAALDASGGTTDDDAAATAARTRLERARVVARGIVVAGQLLLGGGVLLLFAYAYVREWQLYPLVTPMLMAVGAALIAYGIALQTLITPIPSAPIKESRQGKDSRRPGARLGVALLLVLAASVFWTTATLAQWSGRGSAIYAARHLDRLPSVILDTQERLFLTSPRVAETALRASEGQTFRYRYRNLRLLIQGQDRLFLVPDTWSASNSTVVVPMDGGSIRLQFQFRNQPP